MRVDALSVSPAGGSSGPANSPGANQVYDISYSIEPFYEINKFRLIIVLEFKGDKTGETKILLPKGPNINSVRFLKTLTPNTYMTDTDRPEQKIIKYPPGSILRIYYQVEEIRDGDPEPGNHLLAILKRHYFHFSGESIFIVPNWESGLEYNFRIMWNHLPVSWKLANNFGVNSNYQEFKTTIRKFNDASFTGGVISILARYIGNDVIYIATQGKWKFSEEQFCDLVRDIMIEERNFWNDHSTNFFLVDVIQLAGRGDQAGEVSWNGYSVFLSGDRIIDLQLKRLLAHDLFHTWIGEKVTFAQPEQLVYWFKEGFTDYYTNLILLRAKLISLEEYADQYNIILESYYTSPMRYEKNDRLINEFHSDMDLTRLPYQRGQIFAHNLNYTILKNSSHAKSLDDFMRDLMSRCTNENLVISNGSLSALIRFYAGDEILSDMMRTLNSGAVLKAIPEALGPCFKMETDSRKKMIVFGEQFDIPSYKLMGDKDCLGWFHAD
jgi:predicted metalloprotease with PDZ domain